MGTRFPKEKNAAKSDLNSDWQHFFCFKKSILYMILKKEDDLDFKKIKKISQKQ